MQEIDIIGVIVCLSIAKRLLLFLSYVNYWHYIGQPSDWHSFANWPSTGVGRVLYFIC